MKMLRIGQLRTEQGLSKTDLARAARMQPNMVAWIESGRFRPYESQLEKLAKALGESDPNSLLKEMEV